jgi:hypothetical protein
VQKRSLDWRHTLDEALDPALGSKIECHCKLISCLENSKVKGVHSVTCFSWTSWLRPVYFHQIYHHFLINSGLQITQVGPVKSRGFAGRVHRIGGVINANLYLYSCGVNLWVDLVPMSKPSEMKKSSWWVQEVPGSVNTPTINSMCTGDVPVWNQLFLGKHGFGMGIWAGKFTNS